MQTTKIEYLTHAWNPIAMRCNKVSEGCENCWHLRMANRLHGKFIQDSFSGSEQESKRDYARAMAYAGEYPVLLKNELAAPFKLRRKARIGVEFMGDLFHESIPFEWIAAVYGAIAATPGHQFVVLTKRVDIALEFYKWVVEQDLGIPEVDSGDVIAGSLECASHLLRQAPIHWDTATDAPWPLENLIIGASVENQRTADERIPKLLRIPAWKRMVSFEPALGRWMCDMGVLDLVVAGSETGPGARPCDLDWLRSARDQCSAAGVPFFLKQINSYGDRELDGRMHEEWVSV